jgi:hypothetical protein
MSTASRDLHLLFLHAIGEDDQVEDLEESFEHDNPWRYDDDEAPPKGRAWNRTGFDRSLRSTGVAGVDPAWDASDACDACGCGAVFGGVCVRCGAVLVTAHDGALDGEYDDEAGDDDDDDEADDDEADDDEADDEAGVIGEVMDALVGAVLEVLEG